MAPSDPDFLSSTCLRSRSPLKPVEHESPRRLILSLCNPLRSDNGAGSAIVAMLEKQVRLPASVELIDGGIAGMKILTMLEGYDHVILINAVDLGLPWGEWLRLDLDELLSCLMIPDKKGTLHEAGLVDALVVGRAMNMLPARISVYVIQAQDNNEEIGKSSVVCEKITAIWEAILSEIDDSHRDDLLPL
jgi:hydrogenase maturation protease